MCISKQVINKIATILQEVWWGKTLTNVARTKHLQAKL